jgi:hypothetical protein
MENTVYVDANNLRLGLAFQKIDSERRIVSGFATLDNIDAHGDVITAEASKEAFANFRGNIREMHGENPIGKIVNFEEKSFEKNGETFNGIYVDAYISKAAEDTWTKVQEGIFGGFSIGGRIIEKSRHEDDERKGFVITKYELHELSLVDNPANPLANVVAFQKSADGKLSGLLVDTNIVNIHKSQEGVVFFSHDEKIDGWDNIGWVENDQSAISKAASEHGTVALEETSSSGINITINTEKTLNPAYKDIETDIKDEAEKSINEGGVEMAEEINETTEVVDEVASDVVEEATEEVTKEVESLNVDDLMEKFTEKLGEMSESLSDSVSKAVEEAKTSFTDAIDSVKKELGDVKTRLEEVDGRVTSVEDTTATKKSVDGRNDLDAEEDNEDNNIWRGKFFGVSDLSK